MDILRGGWAPGLLGNGAGLRADSPSTGGSYSAEAEAIFAAFTTPPTTPRKDLIDAAVVALKAAGVWTKLDALYAFAAADSQAALINWVAPGTYNGTLVNAPAFTADSGFLGASTKYIDSGFNPTTAPSPKFVQDSACVFAWALTDVATGGIASNHGSGTIYLYAKNVDNNAYGRVNSVAGHVLVASPGAVGFFSANRSSASLQTLYRNGASIGTDAAASFALQNFTNKFLVAQTSEYHLGQCAAGGMGQSLNSTEQTALYNALAAYMAGLSTYQAETNAIAAAFTTPPTTARKNLIDAAVVSLKSAGVWAKLDALYAFAAADSQAAKINWVAPGTYNATEVNAPTFTTDSGFTGASTKYLDAVFNPTTAPSPKFVQNSASAFAWSLTATGIEGAIIGTASGAGDTFIVPYYTSTSQFIGQIASTADNAVANPYSSGLGFWLASRTGASALSYSRNGLAAFSSLTTASGTPLNSTLRFLTRGGQYYAGGIVAAGGFGSQLSAADNTALYNALRTYLTGVGVP